MKSRTRWEIGVAAVGALVVAGVTVGVTAALDGDDTSHSAGSSAPTTSRSPIFSSTVTAAAPSSTPVAPLIRAQVTSMSTVDDATIMDLVRTMCTKLSAGADPRALFQGGVDSGFSERDSQAFMAMSAALYCPGNSAKVTYDAVGWHPGDKPKPKTSISEGTYEVGVDIEAGKYKGTCPNGGYWARYSDDSGDDIIANDLTDGASTMQFTAKKGEFVKVSRCTFAKVR